MRTSIGLLGALCGALVSTVALSQTDPVVAGSAIMVSTTASQNPFFQARSAAITQMAVFEAVNTIEKHFDPYLGTLTAPSGASPEAAAIAAAHDVLLYYFPINQGALDSAEGVSLARIPDGSAKQDGIGVGEAAAAAFIQLRSSDGSLPMQFYVPGSSDPGQWQTTPSCPPAGGTLLQWPHLQPFAIVSTDQFRSAPQPALTSMRYAIDFDEVQRVGSADSSFR